MDQTLSEKITSTDEGMRLFQQSKLNLEFTEMVCGLMEEKGVSRSELAERLGTSLSSITQILDGSRNITMRTASDLVVALGKAVNVSFGPISIRATENDRNKPKWTNL